MRRSCGCGCLTQTIGVILLGAVLYLLHPWILPLFGNFLLRSDPLQKADAIVVLSGAYTTRSQEAAALYHQGWSPRILLTREIPPDDFYGLRQKGILLPESIDLSQQVLEGLGVPRSQIWRLDTPVDNTDQEAKQIGEFLKRQKVRRIIVLTSKTHSRRACLVFHHYHDKDFQIICRYSFFDPFDPKTWWKRRRDMRDLIFEYQKLAVYEIQFLPRLFSR
ncbi:MAG TPA: YdcF family protein [Acidobacteriota bacterium]|jgi:uncharacterized SAM-binding protein YcdF (DUF218 family)|nr:YdcF family protein [Acidobacteriota bacterium]